MQAPILHICKAQHLWLTPQRAVFWEEQRTLIVSDLHLGKTGHFRKAGIAVPASLFKEDLQRLLALIQHFQPEELLVTGDMFHSHSNIELDLFSRWRKDISNLRVRLVKGNHDILNSAWYHEQSIDCCDNSIIGPFSFVHDRKDFQSPDNGLYPISGHIHPGILLNGGGKQQMRLPCFYFGNEGAILPAYSKFTGAVALGPQAGDHIFAIAGEQLFKVQ